MSDIAQTLDAAAVRSELDENGYSVVKGLCHSATIEEIQRRMQPLHISNVETSNRQDRILKPHLNDSFIWDVLSDPSLVAGLTEIIGAEPVCIQSMYYFKPAGSAGLGLHQDRQYIAVESGNCIAVWIAIDPADEENGCLLGAPRSQTLPVQLQPTQQNVYRDGEKAYTNSHMIVPEGMNVISIPVSPGDAVIFEGNLIHGSLPNVSTSRFRRSLVGHFVRCDAKGVTARHQPVWDVMGNPVAMRVLDDPSPKLIE